VGAHLPLDLVGGAGLGMMCVAGVRRAFALVDRVQSGETRRRVTDP
jgi:membrane-associated phospholipid phosphatase